MGGLQELWFFCLIISIAHFAIAEVFSFAVQKSVKRRVNYTLQWQIDCMGKVHTQKINDSNINSQVTLTSSFPPPKKDGGSVAHTTSQCECISSHFLELQVVLWA